MAGGGVRLPMPHGRGGSVSRRDHNQAAGTRAHLTGGTNSAEAINAKRQPLFGREGSGGRGASPIGLVVVTAADRAAATFRR